MADQPSYKLSAAAAKATADAVRQIKSMTATGDGSPSQHHNHIVKGFWALITGDDDTVGNYHYSWVEQCETSSNGSPPALGDYPTNEGGRSGTTTVDYAVNADGEPRVTGTVWMEQSFNDDGSPVYRFHGGRGNKDIKTLPNGTYGAPDTTTWTRVGDDKGVRYDAYWSGWDTGALTFWWHVRTPIYDARGMIYSVSAAVEYTQATTACGDASSSSSGGP